jgi:polysaccharide biosynthesis/export protein
MRNFSIIGLALTVSLIGCATSTYKGISTSASEMATTGVVVEENKYQIGPGDVLNVSVWDNADLSLSVPVRPDGFISLPLVGDIKADGLDAATLAANITKQLETQLRNPQVTVIVSQINSALYVSRVRVTGAVNSPISIQYGKGMSVLDLVLEAGGLSELAAGNRTKLYRTVDGKILEMKVNLDDILQRGNMETNIPIQPGDVITVPERLL